MKALEDFDKYLDEGSIEKASLTLRSTPYLDVPHNSEFLSKIRTHHQEVLDRCLGITDKLNTRAINLGELEALFSERSELLHLFFKARFSYETLQDKRQNEGKPIPLWTQAEFDKKEIE